MASSAWECWSSTRIRTTTWVDDVAAFAGLIAEVVMAKRAYGDFFERIRRRQPMSIASELAWNLLPPLTFGTDRLVISGSARPRL